MPERSRGERAGLSRDRILDEALALADTEGIGALTMRRLAAVLGVEAMTLYNYFPNKDALLDGLVERVLDAAVPRAVASADWQQTLRTYAIGLRRALLAHPGVLPIASQRPASTPRLLAVGEGGAAMLIAAGFDLGRALDIINIISVFAIGHAVSEHATTAVNQAGATGSTAAIAGLDATAYPLLVQAARTGQGTDDEHRFRFAIDALLTGFAATL
ncbi:TetR/AcrR family transcriptional regulator C-terminal domain-containing protein [Rathayibacter sp. YIM 133350]|uniref:TetR/AcrR family transcriptional regulator C-terminal domain-containing protein n=1 Tax=Rathayibacter sp. YIM 133350 TaxID=3131992 RepID=UPI00307DDC3C